MSRLPTLVGLAVAGFFTLACMGGGETTFGGRCDCTVELPTGWDHWDVEDDAWTARSFSDDSTLQVRFLDRSERSWPASASVLLDSWLPGHVQVPPDVAPTEMIDGRPASVRDLGGTWAAMVPYDDGFVFLEAWSDEPDSLAAAVAAARSLHRVAAGVHLPTDVVPVEQADHGVATRPLEVPEIRRWERIEGQEVPSGWIPTTYPTTFGELAAWVSPVRGDDPRPGVVLAHPGVGRLLEHHAARMEPFRKAGLPVMIPSFRGEMGSTVQHEQYGGEVNDLVAAIAAFRERADVDPERVYLVGMHEGSALALFAAMEDPALAGTVLIEGAWDLVAHRERTEGRGFPTSPVPAGRPDQDALRSPVRYAAELESPVWGFHGEWDADSVDGAQMLRAAADAGVPFEWFVVPRARVATWSGDLLEVMARRIAWPDVDDEGEALPLSFDGALADLLGRRAWAQRWALQERPRVQRHVRALARTRLVRRSRLVQAVIEERGWTDAPPVQAEAWRLMDQGGFPRPSEAGQAFHRALSALSGAGLVVRPARPTENPDEALSAAWEEAPGRGFVYTTVEQLLGSVLEQEPLHLYYGDRFPRTDEGTAAIGREVAAALEAEGVAYEWDGSPASTIEVSIEW